MNNNTQIIEALILEFTSDKINARTGGFQSLTKLITVNGDILTVWHDDNRCHGKAGEEVVVVAETSSKTKDDGTPWINYAIVPPAFAKKILSSRK